MTILLPPKSSKPAEKARGQTGATAGWIAAAGWNAGRSVLKLPVMTAPSGALPRTVGRTPASNAAAPRADGYRTAESPPKKAR